MGFPLGSFTFIQFQPSSAEGETWGEEAQEEEWEEERDKEEWGGDNGGGEQWYKRRHKRKQWRWVEEKCRIRKWIGRTERKNCLHFIHEPPTDVYDAAKHGSGIQSNPKKAALQTAALAALLRSAVCVLQPLRAVWKCCSGRAIPEFSLSG